MICTTTGKNTKKEDYKEVYSYCLILPLIGSCRLVIRSQAYLVLNISLILVLVVLITVCGSPSTRRLFITMGLRVMTQTWWNTNTTIVSPYVSSLLKIQTMFLLVMRGAMMNILSTSQLTYRVNGQTNQYVDRKVNLKSQQSQTYCSKTYC